MLATSIERITPDENTYYLVGPEGLVWEQPSFGEPIILAARNKKERSSVILHIHEILKMGLVPYGMPMNQWIILALFGGSPIRDCHWVKHTGAPAPVGDDGDRLPTQAVVIV